jgi:FemAB family protein
MSAKPACFARLQEAAAAQDIELLPLRGCVGQWVRVLAAAAYAPVSHSRTMIAYQVAYAVQAGPLEDCSLLIRHGGEAVGVWPLVVRTIDGQVSLGSNEGAVLPPLFVASLGRKLQRGLMVGLVDCIESLLPAKGTWQGSESFQDAGPCSEWHLLLMERGATLAVGHEMYADLGRDPATIKAGLRKSYKSLLTSATRHWQATVLAGDCAGPFAEFRQLHQQVAGRVTRSAETWERQLAAIDDGAAFLVTLRDAGGRLVGAGLFHVSPHEGLYAVGAYDRSLFDKPLGHLVQWTAIQEMQRRGLRWYKLGTRSYAGSLPAPSDKELSIAHFKQGFASHVFPRWLTTSAALPSPGKAIP